MPAPTGPTVAAMDRLRELLAAKPEISTLLGSASIYGYPVDAFEQGETIQAILYSETADLVRHDDASHRGDINVVLITRAAETSAVRADVEGAHKEAWNLSDVFTTQLQGLKRDPGVAGVCRFHKAIIGQRTFGRNKADQYQWVRCPVQLSVVIKDPS